MILKIKCNNEYHFVDLDDNPSYTIKSCKEYSLYNDGSIFLENRDGKWYIQNCLDKTSFYCGLPFFKNRFRRVRTFGKVKIGKKTYVSFIKEKPYRAVMFDKGMDYTYDLSQNTETFIGRDSLCDIVVDNPQMDLKNTKVVFDGKECFIEDLDSSNGLYVNHNKVHSKKLEDGDNISLASICLMFYQNKLLYSLPDEGLRIDVIHMNKLVSDYKFGKTINLLKDISFSILPGEFVAVVGGSGAGKSTLCDAINGRRRATSGNVFYDKNNFYKYEECYQRGLGYVPQQDIMHTDLSVYKTLYYYAHIKMKHKLSKTEIDKIIKSALDDVFLSDKANLKVSKLSGGQRKRVSIAMELLSDPKVLFLDEPTSGLSPDLDYEIMDLLKNLSLKGKTIVVITHNMENVDKCDKIVFLGNGGHLCYCGAPDKLFNFFGVRKYGKIFSLLSDEKNSILYEDKLKRTVAYKAMVNDIKEIYGLDGDLNV